MKKPIHKIALTIITLFLVGCVNAFQKADHMIGLMQNDTTAIIGQLNRIQTFENQMQTDFESTIEKDESLQYFKDDQNPIMTNIAQREECLEMIEDSLQDLIDLLDELALFKLDSDHHVQTLEDIDQQVADLNDDLVVYVNDYKDNLNIERASFKAISHPDTHYDRFFEVIHNVNTVSTTNSINLDQVLGHFEGLNSNLVNFKVSILDAQNKSKSQ